MRHLVAPEDAGSRCSDHELVLLRYGKPWRGGNQFKFLGLAVELLSEAMQPDLFVHVASMMIVRMWLPGCCEECTQNHRIQKEGILVLAAQVRTLQARALVNFSCGKKEKHCKKNL